MFDGFKKTSISIVAPGGEVRGETKAILAGDEALIDDTTIVIQPGDELRRLLPNGHEEVFDVIDPVFYDVGFVQPHYQVKIRRKGNFPQHTGGNYTIQVSGPNARVNIASQDNSHNSVSVGSPFDDVRRAIEEGVADVTDRQRLAALVAVMEGERNRPGFARAYQEFVASAADHITFLAPFLPALAGFIR